MASDIEFVKAELTRLRAEREAVTSKLDVLISYLGDRVATLELGAVPNAQSSSTTRSTPSPNGKPTVHDPFVGSGWRFGKEVPEVTIRSLVRDYIATAPFQFTSTAAVEAVRQALPDVKRDSVIAELSELFRKQALRRVEKGVYARTDAEEVKLDR